MFTSKRTEELILNKDMDCGGLLRGPFGYVTALVVYLRALNDEKLVDVMSKESYASFLDGEDVKVRLTKKENGGVLRVVIQLGSGFCAQGKELTEADANDDGTLYSVGSIKNEATCNFLIKDRSMQLRVHRYLLEFWESVYGIKEDDPDFVAKLLGLHWQYNPKDKKPKRTTQPTPQPQQPATTASASATVQTDSNGKVTIGGCYVCDPPELKKVLERNRDATGLTDANDTILGTIANNFMQATGIYLGVYGKENSASARQCKAAELIGFEEEGIKTLLGEKPKNNASGNQDQDSKGAEGKGNSKEGEEEFKTKPYRNRKGFGQKPPKIDDPGETATLEQVVYAMQAVKGVALDKDSSPAKKAKFTDAWITLCDIIEMIIEAGRTDANADFVHYQLAEKDVFMLEVKVGGVATPLCFINDEDE